jgi:hypothetical protein
MTDFCVIEQTIQNTYTVKKDVPTLKYVSLTMKGTEFPGGKEFIKRVLKDQY